MYYVLTGICIFCAVLIQFLCSNRIVGVKESISVKKLARREIRDDRERLAHKETSLTNQQSSLTYSIARLQSDIQQVIARLREKGLKVPDPNFPLSELADEAAAEDTNPESEGS